MDSELANIVNNIQSLTARYRRLNDVDKSQRDTTDITTEEKFQSESSSPLTDTSLRRKHDSDSIVRGILSNSMKYDHENAS
ncbi:unnamed protein product, partial [Adineta steineri]